MGTGVEYGVVWGLATIGLVLVIVAIGLWREPK